MTRPPQPQIQRRQKQVASLMFGISLQQQVLIPKTLLLHPHSHVPPHPCLCLTFRKTPDAARGHLLAGNSSLLPVRCTVRDAIWEQPPPPTLSHFAVNLQCTPTNPAYNDCWIPWCVEESGCLGTIWSMRAADNQRLLFPLGLVLPVRCIWWAGNPTRSLLAHLNWFLFPTSQEQTSLMLNGYKY